jgi:hypothetical protein
METLLTNGLNTFLLMKVLGIILCAMYLVFAFVIIRQVKLMTTTLRLGLEPQLTFISYIHLAFAVLVFLAALIIL